MPVNSGDQQTSDEIQRTIAALRGKFLDEIETRILFLEATLAHVRNGTNRMEAASSVAAAAHNIAGLAPSLGFQEIGTAAVETERQWETAVRQQCAASALHSALAAVEMLLDCLEDALDQ